MVGLRMVKAGTSNAPRRAAGRRERKAEPNVRADATRSARPRGRPRSPAADAAIFRAALEILPEQGFRAFSMEAVATRAGVSKATLYRRFPAKRELIAAALRTIRSDRPAPDTGSFRGDLRALVRREVERTKRLPRFGRLAASLLADVADEPDMLALVEKTVMAIDYAMLGEIVRRGIKRGELRPDLDVGLGVELLHAALVFRFLTSGAQRDPLAGPDSQRLVDTLMVGLGNRVKKRSGKFLKN